MIAAVLRATTRHGWGLLLPVLPLCAMGVLSIQASSNPTGKAGLTDTTINQLIYVCLGAAGMGMAVMVGYQRLGRWAYFLFTILLAVLGYLVLDRWIDVPMVRPFRNARCWLYIGDKQFQPSELMKIVYVLALAWYLRYRKNYRTFGGLIAPFILTLIPMALILIQPDLGTVMLFLPVLFAMLYAAGAKSKHLLIIVLLAMLATPFFWFHIKSYQRLRVTGMVLQNESIRNYLVGHLNLWDTIIGQGSNGDAEQLARMRRELIEWEKHSGYQLVRSKMAIATGGVLGQGWNKGIFVQYDLLPEKHNDLIFAMIGHQWGLLGTLLVILCYAAVVIIGFDVATLTNDPFGRLVAVGLSSMLAVQAITNLCMTVGIGPITGITLPFVSAGGSSVISSLLSIGLLISVAHRRPMLIANPPFVFNEEAERYQVPAR